MTASKRVLVSKGSRLPSTSLKASGTDLEQDTLYLPEKCLPLDQGRRGHQINSLVHSMLKSGPL